MPSSAPALSEREAEVAELIARGYSTKEIASLLVVSPETVKTHLKHIFRKCDVRNRAEAAAWWRDGKSRQDSDGSADHTGQRQGRPNKRRGAAVRGAVLATALAIVASALWIASSPQAAVTPTAAGATNLDWSYYPAPGQPQDEASMGIVLPAPGSAVVGPHIAVQVEVFDFALVPPTGTSANPGEGHIMYYLDVDVEALVAPNQPAIPPDPNAIFAASDQTTHTFDNVAPGPHVLSVLLVLDNHVPVFPPVFDKVAFTVIGPSETATPLWSPTPTQLAASTSTQAETSSRTDARPPAPLVLPAQAPSAGSAPAGSKPGPGRWPLIVGIMGIVAIAGGSAAALRFRRRR